MARASREDPFAFNEFSYLVGTALQGPMIIHRGAPGDVRPPFPSSSSTHLASHRPSSSESSLPFMQKIRRRVASTLGSKGKKSLKSSSSVSLVPNPARADPVPPVPPLPKAAGPRISIALPGPLLFQFPAKVEQSSLSSGDVEGSTSQSPPSLRDDPCPRGNVNSSPSLLSRTPSSCGSSSTNPILIHTSDTSLSSQSSEESTAQSSTSSCTSVESELGLPTPTSSHFPRPPEFPQELASTVKHIRSLSRKSNAPRISGDPTEEKIPLPHPSSLVAKPKKSFTTTRDAEMYFWATPDSPSPTDSTQTISPNSPNVAPENTGSRRVNLLKEAHRPSTAPSCASLRSVASGDSDWARTLLEGIPPQYGGGGNGSASGKTVKPKRSMNRCEQRPATSPNTGSPSSPRSKFLDTPHHLTTHQAFLARSIERRQNPLSPPPSGLAPSLRPVPSTASFFSTAEYSSFPSECPSPHPYSQGGAHSKRKSVRGKRLSQGGGDLPPPPSPPPSCPLPSIPR